MEPEGSNSGSDIASRNELDTDPEINPDLVSPDDLTSGVRPARYMSVFHFLDAVRGHQSVEEIERKRKGERDATDTAETEVGSDDVIRPPVNVAGRGGGPTLAYSYTYSLADALRYAIMYGHVIYVRFLLQRHLEESLRDTVCCPLLLLAVRLGHQDIVEALCFHCRRKKHPGSYVDKRGCSGMECGRTSLHVAAATSNAAAIRTLLQYGADAQATDDLGQTALGRLLYRLQPPHISPRTVTCARLLLECETRLSAVTVAAIHRLAAASDTPLSPSLLCYVRELSPGPFALLQIARVVVRRTLGFPRLPDAIDSLNLPTSIRDLLSLRNTL